MKKEIANNVKNFYDDINFPGKYTLEQLQSYGNPIENPFLAYIEKILKMPKPYLMWDVEQD